MQLQEVSAILCCVLSATPAAFPLQVMVGLRAKQAELGELLSKLAAMETDLRNNTRKKEKLEAETELCR